MASGRTSFDKLQRERAKKAKAAAKRERRLDKGAVAPPQSGPGYGAGTAAQDPDGPDTTRLLELIEQVHRQFEDHEISYETFEERKADLLARLPID